MSLSKCFAEQVSQYAETPPDILKERDVVLRFKLISRILDHHTRNTDHSTHKTISDRPPLPDASRALNNLALSFSHTPDYLRFLETACDRTLETIDQNASWKEALHQHKESGLGMQKINARNLIRCFMENAKEIGGKPYKSPLVSFSPIPPDNGIVTCGNFDGSSNIGEIHLNEDESAKFDDPVESSKTSIHEAVHSLEHQVALFYADSFSLDAHMWTLRAYYNALIPDVFFEAYQNQFHERAAFRIENRFGEGLKSILK